MQLGIRGKLIGVTLGLLAVMTAGALLTVRHYFGQQLRQEAEREVRSASHVLRSIIERSGSQLQERGRILQELPSLQTAFTKDPKQLEPLLLEVKGLRAANLLWATDSNGIVLASTGEYPPPGTRLADHPLIRPALAGRETLGFDLFQEEWWLLLTLPIQEKGTVTLALLIGEAYVARLSELLSTEIGFVWGDRTLWSGGLPESIRQEIAPRMTKGMGRRPAETSTPEGGRFLWLAVPVTGGTPPVVAGPTAVLAARLDESVIRRTSRMIGWISLLATILGTFLAAAAVNPLLKQLESTQNRLLQSEKLASIGQLAAGVAHELNNPLMVVLGNTQLANRLLKQREGPAEKILPEIQDLLKDLDQQAQRCKLIVNNLLDFARVRPPRREEVSLHPILDDSVRLVGFQIDLQSIRVAKHYAPDLPKIHGDPDQIKQVFVNVILNAAQAMPTGGILTLETRAQGGQCEVRIQDTGVGIPEEEIQKIFDPFFTTKEVGIGTGLGLALSHAIIQRHKGRFEVSSRVGAGTTISIHLPC